MHLYSQLFFMFSVFALFFFFFFFSSRRRHTRFDCDWSSDVCSSDLSQGHPDFGRTYARALELCRQLGDHPREFTALRGLMLYHNGLREVEKAQHFAEEAMRVAEQLDDAARLVGAHQALGVVLYNRGKLEPALAHFRRGSEMFDPDMQFPDWPGAHPGVQFPT